MYVNKEIHTWSSTYAWFSPKTYGLLKVSLRFRLKLGQVAASSSLRYQRGRPLKETWETHGKLIGNTRKLYEIIGNHAKS